MDEKRLEKQRAALRLKIERARARSEIESLFGRYTMLQSILEEEKIPDLFAQKTPGVKVRMAGYGTMHGIAGVKKLYTDRNPKYKGRLNVHAALGPIIEIAGDGQTAKGLWFLDGEECTPYTELPDPTIDPLGPILPEPDQYGIRKYIRWVWNRVGVDFIKEDGQWKIWHLVNYELIRCPYDEDWISYSITRKIGEAKMSNVRPLKEDGTVYSSPMMPDFDETEYSPYRCYSIGEQPCTELMPPEPYQTFAETFSY